MVDHSSEWEKVHKEEKRLITDPLSTSVDGGTSEDTLLVILIGLVQLFGVRLYP